MKITPFDCYCRHTRHDLFDREVHIAAKQRQKKEVNRIFWRESNFPESNAKDIYAYQYKKRHEHQE